AAAEAVTLDFTMTPVIVKLTEVVTTATGDQRRSELGNAIGSIDAAKVVETSPVSNVQDVLASRTPGVQVTGGSQVGGGSRERHQPGRDREHRDREGSVGGDAVWHRRREWRHRHHDEEGPGRRRAVEW